MQGTNPKFAEETLKRGAITAKEIERIKKKDELNDYLLLSHIIYKGSMPIEDASKLWADTLGVTYVDLKKTLYQSKVVSSFSPQLLKDLCAIPLYSMGNTITIAMAEPKNFDNIKKLERAVGLDISPVFALREDIMDAIEIQIHTTDELEKLSDDLEVFASSPKQEMSKADMEKIAGSQALISFTRTLLLMALKEDASDIHIEPSDTFVGIRFRIDGVLHERLTLAPEIMPGLASRLKLMAGLDITEKRRPQDGRINLELSANSIGFRTSTVPTMSGEKIVLRILGQAQKRSVPVLEDLYLSKENYDLIKKIIQVPSGAFFITGPTGSGKTTTLYSALQFINTPQINIMTIEDPVEYRMAGLNQVQAHHDIGLNFATALRAFLRQDPDVILIGEIRDLETAKIATESALTGHLVLATMHTNDAIQAVTRLVDIGVEPFLVGPSIIGVMSQRLARKICEKCKEEYEPDVELLDQLFETEGRTSVKFYRGKGCGACKHTGYKGRIGIYEMLLASEELRRLIIDNAPPAVLSEAAVKTGYKSMRYDGIKKVLRGLTTVDEVFRLTY